MRTKVVSRARNVTAELEALSRAVAAADEAYLREAMVSVGWERRGWLDRLVRIELPAGQIEPRRKLDEERLVA